MKCPTQNQRSISVRPYLALFRNLGVNPRPAAARVLYEFEALKTRNQIAVGHQGKNRPGDGGIRAYPETGSAGLFQEIVRALSEDDETNWSSQITIPPAYDCARNKRNCPFTIILFLDK